ncbi:hypothetical protein [Paraburkholderia sp.]|uniref:hypothetical protein n=1 Tax=Paraburkholderia sp. TaxID=1926495 RepID=UPI0025F4728E|nr:hypothetical protein [Paraburkholderia sp.]
MKRQNWLLSARIYLSDWSRPFLVGIGFIVFGIAIYLYLTHHFAKEFSDRTMYHAAAIIERVEPLRTTARQGFRQGTVVTLKIRGQDVEHTVEFDAHPGELVDVDYSLGTSGTVYVWGVQQAKDNNGWTQ